MGVDKKKKSKETKSKDSGHNTDDGKKKTDAWEMQILPPKSIIRTNKHKYVVKKQLGNGSYGDVYSVERQSDGLLLAVKVEWCNKVRDPRLLREYDIYRDITKLKHTNPAAVENLLWCYDHGGVPNSCTFLFLPLLGSSLKQLLHKNSPTFKTAIQITIQTLCSIRNFHGVGRIHRDIKPANFVAGRESQANIVFLIDFGMAVRYCKDPNKMPAKSHYEFIGTRNYAARTTHRKKPQTRRDDLESWFYVSLEVFKRDSLWWGKGHDDDEIYEAKKKVFAEFPAFIFANVPPCFKQFATMIDSTDKYRTPNYDAFLNPLRSLAKEYDLQLDGLFEWQKKHMKVEPPKKLKRAISTGLQKIKSTLSVTPTVDRNWLKLTGQKPATNQLNSPAPRSAAKLAAKKAENKSDRSSPSRSEMSESQTSSTPGANEKVAKGRAHGFHEQPTKEDE
ncbi:Protein kinase domain-containing protein [Aphelenchoides besseyi]|nr:Protein kinase domain-containing protein [Aphelenchoides besseyi]